MAKAKALITSSQKKALSSAIVNEDQVRDYIVENLESGDKDKQDSMIDYLTEFVDTSVEYTASVDYTISVILAETETQWHNLNIDSQVCQKYGSDSGGFRRWAGDTFKKYKFGDSKSAINNRLRVYRTFFDPGNEYRPVFYDHEGRDLSEDLKQIPHVRFINTAKLIKEASGNNGYDQDWLNKVGELYFDDSIPNSNLPQAIMDLDSPTVTDDSGEAYNPLADKLVKRNRLTSWHFSQHVDTIRVIHNTSPHYGESGETVVDVQFMNIDLKEDPSALQKVTLVLYDMFKSAFTKRSLITVEKNAEGVPYENVISGSVLDALSQLFDQILSESDLMEIVSGSQLPALSKDDDTVKVIDVDGGDFIDSGELV